MEKFLKQIQNTMSVVLNWLSVLIKTRLFQVASLLSLAYFIALFFIIFSYLSVDHSSYKEGEIAKSTVTSKHTFSYYNKFEITKLVNYISSTIPFYYEYKEDHFIQYDQRLRSFMNIIDDKRINDLQVKLGEKGFFFSFKVMSYIQENRMILNRYTNRLDYLYNVFVSRYTVIDEMDGENLGNMIELITAEGNKKIGRESVALHPLEKELVIAQVRSIYPRMDSLLREVLSEILVNLVEPTAHLNRAFRSQRINKELNKSKENRIINKGDILVSAGDLINQDNLSKVIAYKEYQDELFYNRIGGIIVLSFLLYLLLINRFYTYEKELFKIMRNLLVALLFFVLANLFFYLAHVISVINYIPVFLNVPFAILSISLPLLLNNTRVALILLVSFSLFSFFYPGFEIVTYVNLMSITLFTIFTSKILQNRGAFFIAAVIVGVLEMLFSIVYVNYYKMPIELAEWGLIIVFAMGNGLISSITSSGIMPLLENLLNIPTRFRLLELTNPSTSPLLRRLKTEAPGTYSHSLMLGDMCEAAAIRIGIDSLLTKAGGYYHDIGKMEIPQYFIENQDGKNKHDDIKPSISVSVIKSHVKQGVELAKKYHLPEEVIDYIKEHHGTTAISYFYHQALHLYGDENVNLEDYAYTGPKPQSKGTAILMLADGIEASVRAYSQNNERFTIKIIQDIIDDILQKRMESGQFSECDITIRELSAIGEEFNKFLSGYYHKRIEYLKKQG